IIVGASNLAGVFPWKKNREKFGVAFPSLNYLTPYAIAGGYEVFELSNVQMFNLLKINDLFASQFEGIQMSAIPSIIQSIRPAMVELSKHDIERCAGTIEVNVMNVLNTINLGGVIDLVVVTRSIKSSSIIKDQIGKDNSRLLKFEDGTFEWR